MTLYQSFKNYLKKNGISVEHESIEKGMFFFKHNNLNYVYAYDVDTPSYFRLMLPCVLYKEKLLKIETLKIALEVSGDYKVAKLIILDNDLWASFEQFADIDSSNEMLFETGLRILDTIFNRFSERLKALGNIEL